MSLGMYVFLTMNEAHNKYIILDTILNYVIYLGPQGRYLQKPINENLLHVDGLRRPTCSGFGNLSIDVFLEVQNRRYGFILHLINYLAYGFHL